MKRLSFVSSLWLRNEWMDSHNDESGSCVMKSALEAGGKWLHVYVQTLRMGNEWIHND